MSNRVHAVVDAHNDLLLELDQRRNEVAPFARHWLEQLEAGGVALQVCATWAADPSWLPEQALRRVLSQISQFHRAVEENADRVTRIVTKRDLEVIADQKRIGLMLSLEGAEALGYEAHLIDILWRLGVRMVSLTHSRRNPFADGQDEPRAGGLSQCGRELVDRLVELGCVIDLAHASEPTFADVLERCGTAPLVVSHVGCRAICDTPRNLSDDQIREIAARDGVVAVMALPFTVDPDRPTIARLIDHVDHVSAIVGVDHVGLGADFFAQVADALPTSDSQVGWALEDMRGPVEYPRLLDALADRGYDETTVKKIAGGNLLRVLDRGLPAQPG